MAVKPSEFFADNRHRIPVHPSAANQDPIAHNTNEGLFALAQEVETLRHQQDETIRLLRQLLAGQAR